jgi:uncharacterized membrane protein YqjE
MIIFVVVLVLAVIFAIWALMKLARNLEAGRTRQREVGEVGL